MGNGFGGLWGLWSGAWGGRGLSWPQEPVGKAVAKVRLEVKGVVTKDRSLRGISIYSLGGKPNSRRRPSKVGSLDQKGTQVE